ncbi:hypothetical protein QQS21_006492 [Conoideocrella luteorostrata]|uniref:Pentatricopeptide repeat-containing protein-mitochondrial domain-containing protein n=1 Tax=Conoideocrella luteorostrata TaxID=1105319 RepID=A0AAJ0CPW2_9HYPO|nr:hypothetical protein QQS21_006492 [Conoideocrella luteorostrata]
MRGNSLIYDGLWRCLCPAFDGRSLRRAVSLKTGTALSSTTLSTVACARSGERRFASSNLAEPSPQTTIPVTIPGTTISQSANNAVPKDERLLTPAPPTEETLRSASAEEIIAALFTIRNPRGWHFHGQEIDRHSRIIQLVRYLVTDRGQPPSPFIYECMMDAMVDPQGSVRGIRKLLDDMAVQNMKPTATMCHSALAALANHPDYALRQEILDTMQEFWFTIDTPAKQNVVLGLLRDEQYELAYLRLTDMIKQNARIELWVYDIFIMVFGKLGHVDEMMLLLYRRKSMESADAAMTSILYYVLDVSSQAFHYPGTLFAWNSVVRNSLCAPSDGIAENVLATAARHGDTSLATEALDMISHRTRVLAHHYEAVAEAFAASGDIGGAFRILCIMKQNGIRIARGNTRAVYEALRRHPMLISEAEAALRSISSDQELPAAAVGVVIEAMAESQGTEAAMDLYHDVPTLCGEPIGSAIMQTLIMNSKDVEITRALATDYAALFTEDDDPTGRAHVYGPLVVACAEAGELNLAFRFATLAVKGRVGDSGKDDFEWIKVLVSKAVEAEDGRIWGVVDELGKDEEMGAVVGRILRQMRITRRAASMKV